MVDAVELSGAAAEVARANAERLGVAERVRVFEGSLTSRWRPVCGTR